MRESVTLRVYDLSRGLARQLSPSLLGKQIDGIWHTGVLVFGQEYFFGGGIQVMKPELVVERYGSVQEIPMGATDISRAQFEQFLREISSRFTAATYDLLTHNCNNFTNEVVMYLVGRGIPQHILDLPNEAMSTPMGAMLRPMIENMQNQLNAPDVQTFSLSDSLLPVTVHSSNRTTLSRKFTVSTKPTLHLDDMIRRIKELNVQAQILTEEEVTSFGDLVGVSEKMEASTACDSKILQWWQYLDKLLASRATSILFPALGIFRVLILLPLTTTMSLEINEAKMACIQHLFWMCDGNIVLPSTHTVLVLSVLTNVIAHPIANDLVLPRIAQFLPFVFQSITESTNSDVRVVAAKVLGNCCLALQTEEEMIITMIIGGCIEVLDRLSNVPLHQPEHSMTLEGVVVGVGRLLQTFQAARSLSVELGLLEVLNRLGALPSMNQSNLKPLIIEVTTLI